VHPDTRERTLDTPDVQAGLRAVQEAYLVLRDPVRRAEYDAECRAHDPERRPRGVPVPVRVRRRPAPVREVLLRRGRCGSTRCHAAGPAEAAAFRWSCARVVPELRVGERDEPGLDAELCAVTGSEAGTPLVWSPARRAGRGWW
jgi:hypothetical protein